MSENKEKIYNGLQDNIILSIPEDCIELKIKAKFVQNGKIVKAKKKLNAIDVRDMVDYYEEYIRVWKIADEDLEKDPQMKEYQND